MFYTSILYIDCTAAVISGADLSKQSPINERSLKILAVMYTIGDLLALKPSSK